MIDFLILMKAVALFILPPGGLILLILIGLTLHKKILGRLLILTSVLTLYALSTVPVRDLLVSPLEYASPILDVQQFNTDPDHTAIILLGGGLYRNAPEYKGSDVPADDAMMRTIFAANISKATGLHIYVTGGTPLDPDEEAEAVALKRWLIRFGVDHDKIHTESLAKNTFDNARFTAAMLEKAGITRVVLVTSAIHMPRANWCFAAQGLQIITAPTKFITAQKETMILDYLPNANSLAASSFALHEYLGLLWYRLRY